jgi:2-polyprenyl-6-methoxyphenol hydroxylase-like FAD-dependent oxidoreductase
METLTAGSLVATHLETINDRIDEISPERRVFITHHMLLRILRRRARSDPLITLRYNCGVVDLRQHERKVIVQTMFGRVIADYCVGCDGGGGVTRKFVTGSKVSGPGVIGQSLTIVFRVN